MPPPFAARSEGVWLVAGDHDLVVVAGQLDWARVLDVQHRRLIGIVDKSQIVEASYVFAVDEVVVLAGNHDVAA